jgi:hypothetical protein
MLNSLFGSSATIPSELASILLTVSNIISLGILIGIFLCSNPEDVSKSKKKMTWHVTTIEKERIDKESRLENLKIRDWNPFIKEEHIIKDPTYDDVLRRCPHITFKVKSPVQKWGEELDLRFSHKDGNTWSMDYSMDWNGDPENVAPEKRLKSIIHIVPSDKDYSYTTTEIWHYRLCDKKQLEKEGKDHEHTGMCELVNSVKHVTWHIKAKG